MCCTSRHCLMLAVEVKALSSCDRYLPQGLAETRPQRDFILDLLHQVARNIVPGCPVEVQRLWFVSAHYGFFPAPTNSQNSNCTFNILVLVDFNSKHSFVVRNMSISVCVAFSIMSWATAFCGCSSFWLLLLPWLLNAVAAKNDYFWLHFLMNNCGYN